MSKTIGTGNPLAHADFAVPPLHIPDGEGGAYKTELVLERSTFRVVKLQWWHAPDPRREPHNHPWLSIDKDGVEYQFKSEILAGGYTETRHYLDGTTTTHTYRQGDVNVCLGGTFHRRFVISPRPEDFTPPALRD